MVDKHSSCDPPKKEKSTDILPNSEGVSTSTMERAQEFQNNLPPTSPSFLRPMRRSHVSGGYLLTLPKDFCIAHLPSKENEVVLVDENGIEHTTNYLPIRRALSGGWKAFVMAQKLVEGDVCVFELVNQCRFKVKIVRASEHKSSSTEEVNPAGVLVNSRDEPTETARIKGDNDDELTPRYNLKIKKRRLNSDNKPSPTTFSESFVHFDSFKIQVHDANLDSDILDDLRKKYYELCKSQESYLHKNLNKGLIRKVAAKVISETTKIADAIRAAKRRTDTSDLEGYIKTLELFENFGMTVGFMRARIDMLMGLSRKLKDAVMTLRYQLKDEEDRLNTLKASVKKLVDMIHELEANNEFTDVAEAPW